MSRLGLILLLTIASTTPAFGKDVCFSDSAGTPNHYALLGVKVPAKGRSAPIAGVFISGNGLNTAPISGSLYRDKSDGVFLIDIFVASGINVAGNHFTAAWKGDPFTFAGTARVDIDGNHSPEATLTLSPVSCKSLNLP